MSFKNIPRLYINKDLICNSLIELESRNIHYLKNVLRLKKKQVIRVFNGKDGEWEAEILSSECNSLKCSKLIKPQIFSDGPSIYFALIKGNNLKWLLEKSTELGVANLYPILTNRGNVRNFNYKRAKLNILEASEVSERLDLPILHELRTFEKMLIELQKKKNLWFFVMSLEMISTFQSS